MKAMREKVIPAYGLTDYNLVEGSSPAMLASLDSAIKQNQPIVVTLWQPHWAFSRFPLKVLEDPRRPSARPTTCRSSPPRAGAPPTRRSRAG